MPVEMISTSCTTYLGLVCSLTREGTQRTGLPPAPQHLTPTLLSLTAAMVFTAWVLAILAVMICSARFLCLLTLYCTKLWRFREGSCQPVVPVSGVGQDPGNLGSYFITYQTLSPPCPKKLLWKKRFILHIPSSWVKIWWPIKTH